MPYRIDNIDPRTTVMIVVDMQNDFVAEGAKLQSAQAHAMVPKLAATLRFCRGKGIRVVYTAHVHRRDGSDMGLYDDLYSLVADRSVLVDGSPGAEIYKDLAPAPGEHVIKKHRYSAFFATDLDLILREVGVSLRRSEPPLRARKRPEQMHSKTMIVGFLPGFHSTKSGLLAACSAGYAALFAAATLAPTTRALNSSTVITSAVENASIVNVARWTSAADSAP